ncbi:MAG: hypothetical protein KJI71_04070 [Patescibacteria group bacterium]|nr:hypothetical protein [Patescibacteria group bacterium]
MKFQFFRKKYPKFIYQNYSYKISKKNLEIFFDFKIEPNISFRSKITIKDIDRSRVKKVKKEVLNNLIFNLGLIGALSYWKATCSPIIEVRAGPLGKNQIKWWRDLIINGMGQFFYENKINFRKPNFLKIVSKNTDKISIRTFRGKLRNQVLLPIGGGKDSIVSWEILKKSRKNIECFSLNPTKTTDRVMSITKCKRPIIAIRKIDKKLFTLNRQGFLNGHTPFSAYLAFLTVLLAIVFDKKYIAFSNEKSSNEGNLKYLGKEINHQYSKSFNFEKKFRNYSKKYLAKSVEYFSFLRSLYEIQIARLFSKYPKYFPFFLSCNEAHKTYSGTKKPTGRWCGKCPKCLFIFISLYPFVKSQNLIKIFGKNLFEKKELLPLMKELIGESKFKPFECVGTEKESRVAFYLSWEKNREEERSPYLLNYFEKKILPKYPNLPKESKKVMRSFSKQHNLPEGFEKILKDSRGLIKH